MTTPADRTVDVGEIGAALRRRWRWVLGGALVGLALGVLASVLMAPQYRATATVLLRSGPEGSGGGLLGRRGGEGASLGGLADLLSLGSGLDTELEILSSRAVAGAVVDSLGLQARVLSPRATAVTELFRGARWESAPPAKARYRFVREGTGYRVSGPGAPGRVEPGTSFMLGGSSATLSDGRLPDEFEIELMTRQDAVSLLLKRLKVDKLGGEIAELIFRGPDPQTAAAVPNATVAQYLARRRTSDRGLNQRRYEFLSAHTDSMRGDLARAEQALRSEQERSGVVDLEVYGKAELERSVAVRAELEALDAEAGAFRAVMQQATAGGISARDLGAYPSLLGNPAIYQILSQLTGLDRERTSLLERRTERDPDVLLVDRQIQQLERQLVETSAAYLRGVDRKRSELQGELARYDATLGALPAKAQANLRAQREVMRLSQTLVALETQLVEARLGAIAEGGDVRQVDAAEAPHRPYLPNPWLNLALGLFGGVFFGMVGAVGGALGARRLQDVHQVARIAELPVIRFDRQQPLLIASTEGTRTVLVLPLGPGVHSTPVAERVAATAALRGSPVVLADWERVHPEAALPAASGAGQGTNHAALVVPESLERIVAPEGSGYLAYRANGSAGAQLREAFAELERHAQVLVAALPALDDPATVALLAPERAALLVVELGRTRRSELEGAVDVLSRLAVRVEGVVVRDDRGDDT